MPSNYEYFKYTEGFEEELLENSSGILNELYITLNRNAIEQVRSVYTIWDVLGDIGGLIDMLYLLGKPVMIFLHVILGSSMSQSLLQ